MRKTKRSAFTIVELVIVIAVIAILSAVLIPTFGAIIKNANVAADQSAAATLTTELHIYLKGETIDSEAELMAAINAIDPDGKKLVPKALSHDHHFWFDMENQMIVAGFTEDIKNKTSQSTSKIESQSGAVLTSAELIAETSSNTAFLGMRDVFNNGFFLIDSADALSSMFGDMSSITKDNYATFISTLDNTAKNNEVYGVIAEKVLENVAKTTIFTNGGVFYFSENTADSFVFFADDVKVISNTHYVYDGSKVNTVTNGTLPAPKGALNLPSSVVLVEENSLDFGDGNSVVINTTLADANAIANVFSPLASDATIKDKAGVSYKIVHLDTLPEGDTHEKDRLVLASDNTTWMADLIVKLPFEDYTIGYTEEDSLVEFNTDTLYVSNLKSDDVVLFAKDTKSDATSLSVFKWESDNAAITVQGGVLSFDEDAILAGSHRATITATAKNINGENIVRTLKVEVRMPVAANVTIDNEVYPLGKGDQQLTYYVTAQNKEITPTINGTVTWKSETNGEILYGLRTGELTVKDANETVCPNNTLEVGTSSTTFTISLDGRLETNFIVSVIDTTKSPFQLKYHHSSGFDTHKVADRSAYYVGSGNKLNLTDLFDSSYVFGNGKSAKITVYGWAEGNTALYTTNEINNHFLNDLEDENNGGVKYITADYTKTVTTAAQWEAAYIDFTTTSRYDRNNVNLNIIVEVAPVDDFAMVAYITVVDGAMNVTTIDDMDKYFGEGKDVVLQSDLTNIPSTSKVEISGNNLYGNGYKIVAQQYQPTTKVVNDYFIKLHNGTIDNIYIAGPVYPDFDYDTATNGTHVSGILATGTSTVQNSYVSHFRQPISGQGDVLNVVNTTLEGGNYANLQLVYGHLNLTDVTTIQNSNGTPDTFGKNKKIIGFGIFIESSALPVDGTSSSKKTPITINGYLDQFNWIAESAPKNGIYMPTVMGIDLNKVFPNLYNTDTFSSMKNYVHTVGSDKYVNGGVMCMILNPKTFDDTLPGSYKDVYTFPLDSTGCIKSGYNYSSYIVNNLIVNNNSGKTNASDNASYKKLYSLYMPTFEYKVQSMGDAAYKKAPFMKDTARAAAIAVIKGVISAMGVDISKIDAQINIFTYSNQDFTLNGEGFAIDYTSTDGYYNNYGN